jgi:hypothetical protein
MKNSLFLTMIAAMAIAFAGCNKDDNESAKTPPLAATTQTWTFGDQTWSDAIHCPECNKETFEESYTAPQCRSYTESGKTFYYYNWAYVDANKNKMCPSPWRVPTKEDFEILANNTTTSALTDAWGYGGFVYDDGSVYAVSRQFHYWSSTDDSRYYTHAYFFCIDVSGSISPSNDYKDSGKQVRCVK